MQPSPPFLKKRVTEEAGGGGGIACTVLDGARSACSAAMGYACGTWPSPGAVGQQIPNVARAAVTPFPGRPCPWAARGPCSRNPGDQTSSCF